MSDIQEVWLRLEALAHLRGMPGLKNLRAKIEAELAEMEADLALEEPKAEPEAEPEGVPPPSEDPPASVERKV